MEYSFRTVELRSPKRIKVKVVPVLPVGYEALSNLIATEVESFAGEIRAVMDGDVYEFSGNRYELYHDGDTVIIRDTFAEEDDCTVTMDEFQELILAWVKETEKVRKEDQEENTLLKVLWDTKDKYPEICKAQYVGLTADHSEVLECVLLVESAEALKEIELNGRANEIRKSLTDALRRGGWEKNKCSVSISYVSE
ncbi:MAG: hypothetical protein Q4D71_02900 [Oscillospiraceae bacterium]|nr:hypothetical protein [Oscillospiraceae bacterium]